MKITEQQVKNLNQVGIPATADWTEEDLIQVLPNELKGYKKVIQPEYDYIGYERDNVPHDRHHDWLLYANMSNDFVDNIVECILWWQRGADKEGWIDEDVKEFLREGLDRD